MLEEDLLDLLALMLRDLPSEELWQRSSSHSDISGSQEAGTAGASMLLVWPNLMDGLTHHAISASCGAQLVP